MTAEAVMAAERKMRAAGIADAAIDAFTFNVGRLLSGESGLIADDELAPVDNLPRATALRPRADDELIDRTAVIKVNGGLGTGMGLDGPKSLIEAKDGLSFLEITMRQVLALRDAHRARVPLILMNSFATREATLEALCDHPVLEQDVPVDFLQSQVPKLRVDDLQPVEWPADRRREWCPPGHGDVYTAIWTSGLLTTLLERGYRYAFVSNADNLGASLDVAILAWFAEARVPFAVEAVVGTEADRKGGHLARRRADGRLVIRETAQAPSAETFADYRHWRYYNANNIWLDLRALARVPRGRLARRLPLIVNRKTVDPAVPESPAVLQLETAISAGLAEFDGAAAICVPRRRFIPVKHTDDLLVLRSDAYRLTGEGGLEPAPPTRSEPPVVRLDPRHYRRLSDFEARFPYGAPSLQQCERLTVHGDVTFGANVVVQGNVDVRRDGGPNRITGGTVLRCADGAAVA